MAIYFILEPTLNSLVFSAPSRLFCSHVNNLLRFICRGCWVKKDCEYYIDVLTVLLTFTLMHFILQFRFRFRLFNLISFSLWSFVTSLHSLTYPVSSRHIDRVPLENLYIVMQIAKCFRPTYHRMKYDLPCVRFTAFSCGAKFSK